MRSPHNSQPNVSLGDDADPASELGQRLAAASQTVQGLLTNYLFYGQRRAVIAAAPDAHAAQELEAVDIAEERGRGSANNGTTQATAPVRIRALSAAPRRPTGARTHRREKPDASGTSRNSSSSAPVDPLAEDALSVDGLKGRTPGVVAALEDSARQTR